MVFGMARRTRYLAEAIELRPGSNELKHRLSMINKALPITTRHISGAKSPLPAQNPEQNCVTGIRSVTNVTFGRTGGRKIRKNMM